MASTKPAPKETPPAVADDPPKATRAEYLADVLSRLTQKASRYEDIVAECEELLAVLK